MEKSKKFSKRTMVMAVVLLIIAALSCTVVSKVVSSPRLYAGTMQVLDEKKLNVSELTLATVATATAISAVPGDTTTPIANKIIDLSSYLIIIVGAIYLEKFLLTLTGHVAFSYLIPVACVLYGLFLFTNKEVLRKLAAKLSLFAIVICLVVPVSVKVSTFMEDTYQASVEMESGDVEETGAALNAAQETSKGEEKGVSAFVAKMKSGVANIGDTLTEVKENGERMLSQFIDQIAVLLITSCVIPIGVLMFFIWIAKTIFGINISPSKAASHVLRIRKQAVSKVKRGKKSQDDMD